MTQPELDRAAARAAAVVRARFFDPDGRLHSMPAKRSRQLAALDIIAQRFVPGVRYTESEVNRELIGVFDDYVRLRRDLVDAGMLDRADGQYWRSGGTVPVAEVEDDPVGTVTDSAEQAHRAVTKPTEPPGSAVTKPTEPPGRPVTDSAEPPGPHHRSGAGDG